MDIKKKILLICSIGIAIFQISSDILFADDGDTVWIKIYSDLSNEAHGVAVDSYKKNRMCPHFWRPICIN